MKIKLFVALLVVFVIAVLVVTGYKKSEVKYPMYKTSSIEGFSLIHKKSEEGGKVKWELRAENATFSEGNKEIILKYLTMVIHHDREFILKGGSGVYYIQEKNLTINKPVEIDIEGDKLTTDSLMWSDAKGLVTTNDAIRFKGKKFLIEGTGLTANIQDQRIRILKDVKGVFYR
mgnify:CR=1 FL=1